MRFVRKFPRNSCSKNVTLRSAPVVHLLQAEKEENTRCAPLAASSIAALPIVDRRILSSEEKERKEEKERDGDKEASERGVAELY